MSQVFHDIADTYTRVVLDPSKQPELILLVSFLLTFGFIRTSVHLIKKGVSWWPGNLETKSGLHIHHLVWGILLLISIGFTAIAFAPPSPWREIQAVLFGVGIGLTLDEFALWLNLDDVYWAPKGRESIDAVIIAATLIGILLLGFRFWIELGQTLIFSLTGLDYAPGERMSNSIVLVLCQIGGLLCAIVAFLKHKIFVGVIGLFIPLVALVGALRLGKPTSRWARKRYGQDKLARAWTRFPEEEKDKQLPARA